VLVGVLLYWGALFVATHVPGDDQVDPERYIPHLDKLIHAAAFAGLAMLVCTGSTLWWRPGPQVYLAVIGILAMYAAIDEITQGFVSRRQSDPRDWIADMAGTLLGVGLFAIVRALRRT
jgi:VanZ family protein